MSIKSQVKKLLGRLTTPFLPSHVISDQNRNDRSGALHKAWGITVSNKTWGGYYEFGVYKGDTFRESYRIYQQYVKWMKCEANSPEKWRQEIDWKWDNHFYGFDTFKGMPDNDEGNQNFSKGTFLSSLDEVKRMGEKVGMFEKSGKIKYFQGTFDSIAQNNSADIERLQPAAVVNIDGDLYLSAVDALNIVKTKLQQGTILLMDDWNCFDADNKQGERRAVKEFLEQNKHITLEGWFPYSHTGQSFIVHLNN